jgi:predicted dehydrogenase
MKIVIIGAGRMGVRHAQGAIEATDISSITLVDISQQALDAATTSLKDKTSKSLQFLTAKEWESSNDTADVAIVASTANNRADLFDAFKRKQITDVLIEKPLGQSLPQVELLLQKAKESGLRCFVNLNMRLYPLFQSVKEKLALPQFNGPVTIVFNVGSIGIGANGIHYLDLFFYLFNADKAVIHSAEIDETTIVSGRGPAFLDFGGWAVVKFYTGSTYKGKVFISIAPDSTAFGSMEILGPHARIFINEIDQLMMTSLRKEDSVQPVNRYAADYLPATKEPIATPGLPEFTRQWLQSIASHKSVLPTIDESIKAHRLMFDWLSFSKTHRDIFPIT